MRALLAAAIALAVGLGMCSMVHADAYDAKVEAAGSSDSHTWTYTVCNTSASSDYVLWVFMIEVDGQSSISDMKPRRVVGRRSERPSSQPRNLDVPDGCGACRAVVLWFPGYVQFHTSYQYFTALFNNNVDQTVPLRRR